MLACEHLFLMKKVKSEKFHVTCRKGQYNFDDEKHVIYQIKREPLKLIKIRDQRQKKYGSKKFQAHFVFIFHLYLYNTHLQVNFILNITFFTKVLQKKSASKL